MLTLLLILFIATFPLSTKYLVETFSPSSEAKSRNRGTTTASSSTLTKKVEERKETTTSCAPTTTAYSNDIRPVRQGVVQQSESTSTDSPSGNTTTTTSSLGDLRSKFLKPATNNTTTTPPTATEERKPIGNAFKGRTTTVTKEENTLEKEGMRRERVIDRPDKERQNLKENTAKHVPMNGSGYCNSHSNDNKSKVFNNSTKSKHRYFGNGHNNTKEKRMSKDYKAKRYEEDDWHEEEHKRYKPKMTLDDWYELRDRHYFSARKMEQKILNPYSNDNESGIPIYNRNESESSLSKDRMLKKMRDEERKYRIYLERIKPELSSGFNHSTRAKYRNYGNRGVRENRMSKEKLEKERRQNTAQQVPMNDSVYCHPYSNDNEFEVFNNSTEPIYHYGYIDTTDLPSGTYECKARSNLGDEATIQLKEFQFTITEDRKVDPDFIDLGGVDVSFVIKYQDQPVTNQEANCTFLSSASANNQGVEISFKTGTGDNGTIQKVLPPGDFTYTIESINLTKTTSITLDPTPKKNRDEAINVSTFKTCYNKDATVAGSTLCESGDVVVLGDASGSMDGRKFETLIKCLLKFVDEALSRDQSIAIALWGSTTEWFNHGNFIKKEQIKELETFLRNTGANLGGTYLLQAISNTMTKKPDIEHLLVMCDGEIGDIRGAEDFKQKVKDQYPNKKFSFTGIGAGSTSQMEMMARYGGGSYEFSDV